MKIILEFTFSLSQDNLTICSSDAMYDECSNLTGFANEEIRKLACSGMMHVALGISKIRNDNSKLAESIKKCLNMILNDQDNRIVLILIRFFIFDS